MSTIPPEHGPEAGQTPSFHGRSLSVTRGSPLPLGASRTPSGINFVVVSRNATAVRLVLSNPRDPRMEAEVPLDSAQHRTGDLWHVRVDGLPEEFCYGYRVTGPDGAGHGFDAGVVLLDPASRALSNGRPWGAPAGPPRRSLLTHSISDEPAPPSRPRSACMRSHQAAKSPSR